MKKGLISKTRAPRGSKEPKEPTHVTAEQAQTMHEYCITPHEIALGQKRQRESGNVYIPRSLAPVCVHPKHDWCMKRLPTPEELEAINARLAGMTSGGVALTEAVMQKLADEAEKGYDLDSVRKGRTHKWTKTSPVRKSAVRKEAEKVAKLRKAVGRYYCLKCEDWHYPRGTTFPNHLKYKRGPGRPWPK